MDTTQKGNLFVDYIDSGADTHSSYSKITLDGHCIAAWFDRGENSKNSLFRLVLDRHGHLIRSD